MPPGEVFQPGGLMLMATSAKKHLTIFARSRHASGAGRTEVKERFRAIAANTGGEPIRGKRNVKVKQDMLSAGLKTGVVYKRSRSKYAPLAGKFYKLSPGETVGSAIARRGLEGVISESRGGGGGGGTIGF